MGKLTCPTRRERGDQLYFNSFERARVKTSVLRVNNKYLITIAEVMADSSNRTLWFKRYCLCNKMRF